MTRRSQSCDASQYRHGCDPPGCKVVSVPQTDAMLQNRIPSSRAQDFTLHSFLRVLALCALVSGLVGCGSPVSEPAAERGARAAATRGSVTTGQGGGQIPDSSAGVASNRSGQSDRLSSDQPVPSAEKTDEDDPSPIANIPEVIAKDLASPDARDRYRALDYWDTLQRERADAPIDLVFEAMEDEDPAVRAKATAIVDQYWEKEQERENNGGESEEGS